jgi:tetratricopeptide (TPR) repeat protein
MMADDWFRKVTWSVADAEDFRKRLLRARPHNRAQYLRIQAVHLAQASRFDAALGLLEEMVADYPDAAELSMARCQMGECHEALGARERALECYEQALDLMRATPSARNRAWSRFALLVARSGCEARYAQALTVLDAFAGDLMFPVDHFEWHAARALILSRQGHLALAQQEAGKALSAAGQDMSGFRYHPDVGLVGPGSDELRREMDVLATPRRGWLARWFSKGRP